MPLYFAYGSNMDEDAMRQRCPRAKALGTAQLKRHRFVLMGNGYASVHRDPRADVHGVLFDLALSDVGPLDRYEEVAAGLYTKELHPVLREGGAPCQALIYFGTDRTTGGTPPKGYVEAIVDAARTAGLPATYVAMLQSFMPNASRYAPASTGPRS
jgi:hypothetical protein